MGVERGKVAPGRSQAHDQELPLSVRMPLREVLQVLKLTDVFPIYNDEQQAVQSFVMAS